jgi:hypothetical protein
MRERAYSFLKEHRINVDDDDDDDNELCFEVVF